MEKKKMALDMMISRLLKRGNKQQDMTNSSKVEEDQWIFLQENQIDEKIVNDQRLLENQIDERRVKDQRLTVFLIVLGIVLIYVNYFDVLLVIGKDCGLLLSRMLNLCAAFVITVTGLIMWENTKDMEKSSP